MSRVPLPGPPKGNFHLPMRQQCRGLGSVLFVARGKHVGANVRQPDATGWQDLPALCAGGRLCTPLQSLSLLAAAVAITCCGWGSRPAGKDLTFGAEALGGRGKVKPRAGEFNAN